MRRIFYDTEFLEDGKTIELISIGMVDEDGNEFYGINYDAPWGRIAHHPWLVENVMPHLPTITYRHPDVMPKPTLASRVSHFLAPTEDYRDMELWANNCAYDHVALCQLIAGRMIDLPTGIPWFTNDLQQLWRTAGYPEKPAKPANQHNALADARWNLEWWKACQSTATAGSAG